MAEPDLDPDAADELYRPSPVATFLRERPILVAGLAVLAAAVALMISGPLSLAEHRYRFGGRESTLLACRGLGSVTALALLAAMALVRMDAERTSEWRIAIPVAWGAVAAATVCAAASLTVMVVMVTVPAHGSGGISALDRSRLSVVIAQVAAAALAGAVGWMAWHIATGRQRVPPWPTVGNVIVAAAAASVLASAVAALTLHGEFFDESSGGFASRLSLLVAAAVTEATMLTVGVAVRALARRDESDGRPSSAPVQLLATGAAAAIIITNSVMAVILAVRGVNRRYYVPSSGLAADVAGLVAGGVIAAAAIVLIRNARAARPGLAEAGPTLTTAAGVAILSEFIRVLALRPRTFSSLGVSHTAGVPWQQRLQQFNQPMFTVVVLLLFGGLLIIGSRHTPTPAIPRISIAAACVAAATGLAAAAHIAVLTGRTRTNSLYLLFIGAKEGNVVALIGHVLLAAGCTLVFVVAGSGREESGSELLPHRDV